MSLVWLSKRSEAPPLDGILVPTDYAQGLCEGSGRLSDRLSLSYRIRSGICEKQHELLSKTNRVNFLISAENTDARVFRLSSNEVHLRGRSGLNSCRSEMVVSRVLGSSRSLLLLIRSSIGLCTSSQPVHLGLWCLFSQTDEKYEYIE